jgi:hypothetical protein
MGLGSIELKEEEEERNGERRVKEQYTTLCQQN